MKLQIVRIHIYLHCVRKQMLIFNSGTLLDKNVSEQSHLPTTEAPMASASFTMLLTWTPSTMSSNGFKKSIDMPQRV